MTLTTSAKDYIATYFGRGTPKCFVSSGISYTDPAGSSQTGSTQDVVSTLKMDIGGKSRGPKGEVYTDIPSWSSITNDDITWIGNHQTGTAQYCVGVTPPPPPGEKPETKPFEVYVGGGASCPAGAPSVTLDTSEAFAYFKAVPVTYVGVMDIFVHNLSSTCFAYFAWEMRLWDGYGYTTCPTTAPELQEISRFLGEISDKKVISVTRLNASENKMIGGSFEVPSWMEGEKTICLSLWGDFDKSQLLSDLADQGYEEKIPW